VRHDRLGNAVAGSAEAVALYDDAVDRSLRHDGGVAEAARAATTADPTFAAALALLALADPAQAEAPLARARASARAGSDYERSLVAFVDLLLSQGMWAALETGLDHARAHPRDLLGVGLVGTMVERSTRTDVHEAVLAVYEPSRRALGDHPYLLCMVGFVAQEQGRFAEAGAMADRALHAQPTSVTAAHLLTHVRYETADHGSGLAWLDGFRAAMHPHGDYVHHLGWHAALHTLALGEADETLQRLGDLAAANADDARHVIDTGTLVMRCRLRGLLAPEDDPTHGRSVPPPAWLAEMPSMYLGFHAAVGLAVARRSHDLRALAHACPRMVCPGAGELLAPLAGALADYVEGAYPAAADALAELRPTMHRWGGSRAQRDVVEDMLIDAAVRGGRVELATTVLTERVERRPSRWDTATLRTATGSMWQAVRDDLPGHH
jgi:tetratricopeptide (TPR) repeat protein